MKQYNYLTNVLLIVAPITFDENDEEKFDTWNS